MIIKKFTEMTLAGQLFVEVPEYYKPLYLVCTAGMAYFTDVNMNELRKKLNQVNDNLDFDSLQLERPAESMKVIEKEDGTGYAFKFVDNGKLHYVEPQIFVSGLQFSCEVFMSMSTDKLLSLTLESRQDLEQQLNTDGKLIAVTNIDGTDRWYPKIYPFFYNAYNINENELQVEKVIFALVAWVSAINEKYENMLHSGISPYTPDLTWGLREVL